MSMRLPFLRKLMAVGSLLLVGGCAATTPPPQFTAVSPADPAAAEGAVPPPAALLTGTGDLADRDRGERAEKHSGQTGHGQHGAAEGVMVFTCAMHPEVSASEPGPCPICGMALRKKAATTKERP